jgi:hypothetical protein
LGDEATRRRSSEFVTGVMRTLAEARSQIDVRMLTRSAAPGDKDGISDTIGDFASEGTAIVAGGFTTAAATQIVRQARLRLMSVVVLSPVEAAERDDYVYWVETGAEPAVEVWHAALPPISGDERVFSDTDSFCAGNSPAPFESWSAQHVKQVLVLSDATCSEQLARAAADSRRLPAIWLGPEAACTTDTWRSGQISGWLTFANMSAAAPVDPALQSWLKRFSRLPGYYEAIGHDIALLAIEAFRALPLSQTTEPTGIARERRQLNLRFSQVRAPLWTTKDKGFSRERSLRPNLQLERPQATADKAHLPGKQAAE